MRDSNPRRPTCKAGALSIGALYELDLGGIQVSFFLLVESDRVHESRALSLPPDWSGHGHCF